jgi:hypothetical protein
MHELAAAVAAIQTHNSEPVTPESLRWAATHESMCRSWIFDVLVGLANQLEENAHEAREVG